MAHIYRVVRAHEPDPPVAGIRPTRTVAPRLVSASAKRHSASWTARFVAVSESNTMTTLRPAHAMPARSSISLRSPNARPVSLLTANAQGPPPLGMPLSPEEWPLRDPSRSWPDIFLEWQKRKRRVGYKRSVFLYSESWRKYFDFKTNDHDEFPTFAFNSSMKFSTTIRHARSIGLAWG